MNQSIGLIVLAAGASTRMGQMKQLLRYEGETLLRRAVRIALNSSCRPVIIVLGSQAEVLRDEIADTQAHVVINPHWAEGMGSSVRCGIAALEAATQGTAEAAVLMLCDQPFVTASVIDRLLAAYQVKRPRLVASEYEVKGEKIRGVPALFRLDLFSELMALRGAEGAKRIISKCSPEATTVAVPEGSFDIDTPADYQSLQNGERTEQRHH